MPEGPQARESPMAWGDMELGDLINLLEHTTNQLVTQHKEVALDEGAYHRQYWSHWQELPEGLSIAAMQRECEMFCRGLGEEVTLGKSLREGYQAKHDALIAVVGARSR